jgi:hypothetical protein
MKKRAGGVAQGVGPEFKPQYHQKKKKTNNNNTKQVWRSGSSGRVPA